MTDLVERLRSAKFPFRAEPLIVDAAYRIESLERTVAQQKETQMKQLREIDALTAEIEEQSALIEKLAEALDSIAFIAESHPLYMLDCSDEEVQAEGGDAAMLTLDIARPSREALRLYQQYREGK